ncbi:MAG: helix-turn-helix domain-containing protein [Selenomonadaceae bacterium]|nr:helix-turn-helix domain-containing protein [Selenomonadaceae bacterium]
MLGNTLRAERERQNLSVEDIEQGTSIRALYIEAIENGEYDKLPGEVYTRGFIKNYAKFLGLDGDEFSKQFTAEIHGAPSPSPVSGNSVEVSGEKNPIEEIIDEPKIVKPVNPVESVKPAKAEKKSSKVVGEIRGENRGSSNTLIVAAVVIIAALAGGAWSFLSGDGGDVATKPPAQTQQQPQPENPTPVANANPAPPAPIDGVKVDAKFVDRCWILVTIDGNVAFESIVDAGENLSWEGKDSINLRLGNAGAVELTHNGQNLGLQGGVGDVVDKTFTKN